MTFPDQRYSSPSYYAAAYFEQYAKASTSVDVRKLADAIAVLQNTYENDCTLYVCGNGGSASISNHLACDHGKLLATDTDLLPHVQSLATNVEVITAIANDISYEEVFVYQLKTLASPGDALITISSSGDSENIVKACQWAKDNGVRIIAMTGFDGGRSRGIADVSLHVDADNYGVIEDLHQSLMHVLAQFIRQKEMDDSLIADRKF